MRLIFSEAFSKQLEVESPHNLHSQTLRAKEVSTANVNAETSRSRTITHLCASLRPLMASMRQNTRIVVQRIIPAGATISELEKKAADCEYNAKRHAEPEATKLREEALLYREWIAVLRSGKWHS